MALRLYGIISLRRIKSSFRELVSNSNCSSLIVEDTPDQDQLSEDHPNQFIAFLNSRPLQRAQKDEYDRYLHEPLVNKSTIKRPLQWWLDPIQRSRYPYLSIMALDILSIPAMSADTERLFSQAKLTLSTQRQNMDARSLEILQCLQNWDRSSLIASNSTVSKYSILLETN